jgi:hypothetical protein
MLTDKELFINNVVILSNNLKKEYFEINQDPFKESNSHVILKCTLQYLLLTTNNKLLVTII